MCPGWDVDEVAIRFSGIQEVLFSLYGYNTRFSKQSAIYPLVCRNQRKFDFCFIYTQNCIGMTAAGSCLRSERLVGGQCEECPTCAPGSGLNKVKGICIFNDSHYHCIIPF